MSLWMLRVQWWTHWKQSFNKNWAWDDGTTVAASQCSQNPSEWLGDASGSALHLSPNEDSLRAGRIRAKVPEKLAGFLSKKRGRTVLRHINHVPMCLPTMIIRVKTQLFQEGLHTAHCVILHLFSTNFIFLATQLVIKRKGTTRSTTHFTWDVPRMQWWKMKGLARDFRRSRVGGTWVPMP